MRISVIRTFGLVLVVVGLILTIYGHLASRTCVNNCPEKGRNTNRNDHGSNQRNSKVIFSYEPSRQATGGGSRFHKNAPPPPSSLSPRQHNEKTVKYCKLFGPILFVTGLFIIFASVVLERRRRVSVETLKERPLHWTEEIAIQVLAERRMKQQELHYEGNNSSEGYLGVNSPNTTSRSSIHHHRHHNTTILVTNAHATYDANVDVRSMTCLTLTDLDESVIIEPPPAYEEIVTDIVGKEDTEDNSYQDLPEGCTPADRPPSYEESTTASSTTRANQGNSC